MPMQLYFDHNATAPLEQAAADAWLDAARNYPGNPSSPHRIGNRAEVALDRARASLAAILGCEPSELVWTSGATESANTVLRHLAATLPQDQEVWVSQLEHPCVIETAKHCFGPRCVAPRVNPDGRVDLTWIEQRLRKQRPGFLACMAANNETGVLQPWRECAVLLQKHEIPLVCDATQWLGRLPATGLGSSCSFVFGSGHKLGAPRGIGFLKTPAGKPFRPLLMGGGQEETRRAGTENVAGAVAFAAMLELCERRIRASASTQETQTRLDAPTQQQLEPHFGSATAEPLPPSQAITSRLETRATFEAQLIETLPGSVIVGAAAPRLWNTVSVLMPRTDCQQRWVVKLDRLGAAVSTGSACASGKEKPSHVLLAMGCSEADASRALRFSGGWETSPKDWDQLLQLLQQAWLALRP